MSQLDERSKESLSAMLDNEADDLEIRRILKSSEPDQDQHQDLLDPWERYNLVQSAIQDSALPVSSELSKRIAEKIDLEAVPVAPAAKFNWQQGMAKLAVAASVALVFTFAIQTALDNGADNSFAPAQVAEGIDSASATLTLVADTETTEVDPLAQQRLRDYIESMTFDEEEPVRIEHIQDSPLYRLVNELQAKD